MGLILSVTTSSGLSIGDSYARIGWFNGSKESMNFALNYYISQETATEGKEYLLQVIHAFEPSVGDDSPNFIQQGYEHLKNLSEFSDAIDA